MPEVATRSDTSVRLRVLLPDDIAAAYDREAKQRGVDIETILSRRLAACVSHTAAKPLYFDDAERQELERMLGKNVAGTHELLALLRNLISVKIGAVKITLQPGLLSRLKTRCLGIKWEDFLEQIVVHDLERYVGMR